MSGSRAKRQRAVKRGVADYSSVDRSMIRDDVDWLYSTAQSVSGTAWESFLGITLAPQMARVVHEGFEYLLRRRPAVGKALQRRLSSEIAAARHTIKLVDDDQRSIYDVLDGFRAIAKKHTDLFLQGPDLVVFSWRGNPISTSRIAEYQTLASVDASDVRGTAFVMGQSMASLLQQGLGLAVPPWKQLQLPDSKEISQTDQIATNFYPSVYSAWLSDAEKDLLLTAESSLHAFSLYENLAGDGFVGPVFRGWIVALSHAISTVKTVLNRHDDVAPEVLREVLLDKHLRWLFDQRALRNRSMHYGVPPALGGIESSLPMYGIVEAVCHEPFLEVLARLRIVSADLARALSSWRRQLDGV